MYYLDRLERIAFNALPGTIDPTQWRHQYLQQAGSAAASPSLPLQVRARIYIHIPVTMGGERDQRAVRQQTASMAHGWSRFHRLRRGAQFWMLHCQLRPGLTPPSTLSHLLFPTLASTPNPSLNPCWWQGWSKFASFVALDSTRDQGLVLSMLVPIRLQGHSLQPNPHPIRNPQSQPSRIGFQATTASTWMSTPPTPSATPSPSRPATPQGPRSTFGSPTGRIKLPSGPRTPEEGSLSQWQTAPCTRSG